MIRILCPVSVLLVLIVPSLPKPADGADEVPPMRSLIGHIGYVGSVAFSPDGKLLASAGTSGYIIVWDTALWKKVHTIKPGNHQCNGVAFSPDSKRLAAITFDDEAIKVYSMETGGLIRTMKDVLPWVVAYSPDGKTIATGSGHRDKGIVKLWDANSGELKHTLEGHLDQVTALAFSPDSKTLASVNTINTSEGENHVRLWELETGKQKQALANGGQAYTVAFSPDGKWLASDGRMGMSPDSVITVWDAATGAIRRTFNEHLIGGGKIAFSYDSKTLAHGHMDDQYQGRITLWDVESGAVTRSWTVVSDYVQTYFQSLSFSPDGKLLATSGVDPVVRVWDLSKRK